MSLGIFVIISIFTFFLMKLVVKENNNLNGWINSQLRNKMKVALKSGNVTSQQYTDEIDEKITSIETTNPDVLDQEKALTNSPIKDSTYFKLPKVLDKN